MATSTIATFHNDPEDHLFGQVTEEAVEAPDPLTRILRASDFDEYAASCLGGGDAGRVRLITVLDAGRSAGGLAAYWVKQYDRASSVTKDVGTSLFTALAGARCATDDEAEAITDNWPMNR